MRPFLCQVVARAHSGVVWSAEKGGVRRCCPRWREDSGVRGGVEETTGFWMRLSISRRNMLKINQAMGGGGGAERGETGIEVVIFSYLGMKHS